MKMTLVSPALSKSLRKQTDAAAPKSSEVFDVSICSKMSAESLTVGIGRRRQRRLGGQTVLGVLPQRLIRSGSALPG
jgi:hypothetical protein